MGRIFIEMTTFILRRAASMAHATTSATTPVADASGVAPHRLNWRLAPNGGRALGRPMGRRHRHTLP